MVSLQSSKIGPFTIRVRNLRTELETGLKESYRFKFPHDRFAGTDLQGRLAAVASDYLHVPPKRIMMLSGRIEGEGPRLDFAVLTGNPAGIASSQLAYLILANYEGQTNVVVKVEDIEEFGVTRVAARKPRTAKAPAAAPPAPELQRRHLDIETSPQQSAIELVHRLIMQHGREFLRVKPFEEACPDVFGQYVRGQMTQLAFIDAVNVYYGWEAPKRS